MKTHEEEGDGSRCMARPSPTATIQRLRNRRYLALAPRRQGEEVMQTAPNLYTSAATCAENEEK